MLAVGLLIASASASGAICTNSVSVTAVGIAEQGATSEAAGRQAVAQALAAAITQVNGALVRQQTSIETTIRTVIGETAEISTDEQFHDVIERSTAGVISSYRLLDEKVEHGLTSVRISADVCTDPRAAVTLSGDLDAANTIRAGVVPHLRSAGWRITELGGLGSLPAADAYLRYGATVHVRVDAHPATFGTYRSLTTVQLAVTATMTDLRTDELAQSHAFQTEGIGNSQAAAIEDAAQKAALAVAARFQDTWSLEGAKRTLIRFVNVNRPSTRFEMQNVLDNTPGLTQDGDLVWDDSTSELTAMVVVHGDPCALGAQLAGARRILMRVESCQAGTLVMRVQRE